MKRCIRFGLLFVFFVSCFISYAQDATKIMSDFLYATNINKHKGETLRMEMSMNSQGTVVPIIISFSENRKMFRLEMTIQNTEVAMVMSDNHGWIESNGQKQDLPDDFIVKTRGMTFFAAVSEIMANSNCVYKSGNETFHQIGVSSSDGTLNFDVLVNKTTGFIDEVEMHGKTTGKLFFSDYKKFIDIQLPSHILAVDSQAKTDFFISGINFGVKFPEWYFGD